MKFKALFYSHFWWSLKHNFCCLLNPRQKWLTKKIPKLWMDKDGLMELCLFEMIIHYVEEERGLHDDYDYTEDIEAGFVTQEYVDSVRQQDQIIRDVYNYIKVDRPALEKQISDAYPPLRPFDDIFVKCEDGSNNFRMTTIEEEKKCYEEVRRLEAILFDKDTEAMTTIVKQRAYLWT